MEESNITPLSRSLREEGRGEARDEDGSKGIDQYMPEKTPENIGIMADSHGDSEAIVNGALYLKKKRFGSLHLPWGRSSNCPDTGPCIIACGALTSGWVMLWKPERERLECRAFA